MVPKQAYRVRTDVKYAVLVRPSSYTCDVRDDLSDGVDRNRAFDNDYDPAMNEPGD